VRRYWSATTPVERWLSRLHVRADAWRATSGRFGGKAAIDEFTELRWTTVQLGPRHYPF
jgi:hypothetical protein